MRREYIKSGLIGLGFFAACLLWSVYSTYVPLILNTFITSTFLIALVTAFANSLGAVLHPVFGALSDKTRTPFGRRMPFLLVGIPLSVISLVLIPSAGRLAVLLLLIAFFNAVMSVWRTPTFALISDLTPSHFRSQANGVVNFMGGLGSILAFGLGGLLFKLGGIKLPFFAVSVLALLALFIMKLSLREPGAPMLPGEGGGDTAADSGRPADQEYNMTADSGSPADQEHDTAAIPADPANQDSGSNNYGRKNRSLIAILSSLLLYSLGIGAVETFFSLYATTSLTDGAGSLLTGGDASLLMGVFSFSFMLFAIPAGLIAGRFGRKRTIFCGLAGITAVFFILYFTDLSGLLIFVLILGGICCALVNINFLPAVTELARYSSFGRYTGYYHLITFGSTVISPILFGIIRDLAGSYQVLFLFSGIASFAAIIPLLFVAKGEGEAAAVTQQDGEAAASHR